MAHRHGGGVFADVTGQTRFIFRAEGDALALHAVSDNKGTGGWNNDRSDSCVGSSCGAMDVGRGLGMVTVNRSSIIDDVSKANQKNPRAKRTSCCRSFRTARCLPCRTRRATRGWCSTIHRWSSWSFEGTGCGEAHESVEELLQMRFFSR